MPISTSAHFTPCQINFKIGVINKIISLPTWADEESSWPNPRLWPIAWARLLARIWGSNGFTSTLIPTDLSVQIRPTLAVVVSPLEKEFLPLKLKYFWWTWTRHFVWKFQFMCIEVSCYLRTNCVGMIYVWYHLNISGLLWSTFKYNRNWITGYKIGSLYLIYCIVIRIFLKNKNLYSREHLGGVFLNIVKLSLGVGAQIIKCFIYLQLFWNSSSLVLILPCFQINYWQPCFQRGFEILKRTIMCSYRHNT